MIHPEKTRTLVHGRVPIILCCSMSQLGMSGHRGDNRIRIPESENRHINLSEKPIGWY